MLFVSLFFCLSYKVKGHAEKRTSACSALFVTFPALTHRQGLDAGIQWTCTQEYVTSDSVLTIVDIWYDIYSVITSLYVCLCVYVWL